MLGQKKQKIEYVFKEKKLINLYTKMGWIRVKIKRKEEEIKNKIINVISDVIKTIKNRIKIICDSIVIVIISIINSFILFFYFY